MKVKAYGSVRYVPGSGGKQRRNVKQAKDLEQQSDYKEQQADALLDAANTYADLGQAGKAAQWQREAAQLYSESATLARQAAMAYRAESE